MNTASNKSAPAAHKTLRRLILVSLAGLLLSITAGSFLRAPVSISFWLIQILPLLAFLPALLRGSIRAHQWLCFVIQLYFIVAILRLFNPDTLLQGICETFFTVFIFSTAVAYVHRSRKRAKPTPVESAETNDDANAPSEAGKVSESSENQ